MAVAEGTTPEHDPLTRSVSARAEARGLAKGRMEAVAVVLRARGIEVTTDLAEDPALAHGLSDNVLMAAAVACTGESDFRWRVRELRGRGAECPASPSSDPEP